MSMIVFEKIANLIGRPGKDGAPGARGPQGPAGTFSRAEAISVPADQPASVELVGNELDKWARFFIPRGLPGVNAVANDEAAATLMTAFDSQLRAATERAISEHDALEYPIENFLNAGTERTRWRNGQYQSKQFRIDAIMQRAHDALYLLSAGVDPVPGETPEEAAARPKGDGRPRVIRFPNGQFKMDVAVRPGFHGKVGVIGAGGQQTVFHSATSNQFWAPDGDPNLGGWVEGQNPFYRDMLFANFGFNGWAQTGDGENGTGWGGGNKKFFSLGHVKDSRFLGLYCEGTWNTAYGIDFNDGNLFIDCKAFDCGRGRYYSTDQERIGSGAGFGLGSGTFKGEMTMLIGCVAKRCGSNGFFFEQLNRPEAVHKAIGFMVIGGWSEANNIGVSDAGGFGAIVQGMTLLNNRRAGYRIGGTQPGFEGGQDGLLTGCTIQGNAIGVELDNSCEGGYTVTQNNIAENIIGVSWENSLGTAAGEAPLWPGRGTVVHKNRLTRNKAAGVVLRNRMIVAEASITENAFEGNGWDSSAVAGINHDPRAVIPGDIVVDSDTYKLAVLDNTHARGVGWPLVWAPNHDHEKRRVKRNDYEDLSRNPVTASNVTFIGGSVDGTGGDTNAAAVLVTNLNVQPTPVTVTGAANSWTTLGDAANREIVAGSFWGRNILRVTSTAAFPTQTAGGAATTVAAGQVYRSVMHVRGPVGSSIRPGVWEHGNFVSGTPVPATGEVQEVTFLHIVSAGTTALRPGASVSGSATGAVAEFHGGQLTAGREVYPFIAGFRAKCVWTGTPDASTSTRSLSVLANHITAPLGNSAVGWTQLGNPANLSQKPGGFYGQGQIEVAATAAYPNPTVGSPFVLASPGQTWTGFLKVKGRRGDRINAVLWESGTTRTQGMSIRATGEWQEVWITRKLGAGAGAIRMGAEAVSSTTLGGPAIAGTLIVDGAMLIRGGALPRCIVGGTSPAIVADGDEWTGPPLRSMSVRHLTSGIAA